MEKLQRLEANDGGTERVGRISIQNIAWRMQLRL